MAFAWSLKSKECKIGNVGRVSLQARMDNMGSGKSAPHTSSQSVVMEWSQSPTKPWQLLSAASPRTERNGGKYWGGTKTIMLHVAACDPVADNTKSTSLLHSQTKAQCNIKSSLTAAMFNHVSPRGVRFGLGGWWDAEHRDISQFRPCRDQKELPTPL
jgi:hypothetical protein